MSGTDGEEDFKALDGEEDLGLFGDLSAFEGLGIEEESAVGEQSSESGGVHCPHCLGKYKNPRVLSCLHVLCETCLKELLMSAGSSDGDDDNEAPYSGRKSRTGIITCPQCRQETVVIRTIASISTVQ
jgi:transposase-like protein